MRCSSPEWTAWINCAHDVAPEWRDDRQSAPGDDETRREHAWRSTCRPELRTGRCCAVGRRQKGTIYGSASVPPAPCVHVTPPHDAEPPLAQIGCSLAEAFAVTRCGHHVWLDDGKLGGVAEAVDQDSIELRITSAGAKGSKLRAGKGINLPDAVLDIDLLGFHSRDALQFAAEHADIVELSFVSRAHEVERVTDIWTSTHAQRSA